MCRKSYPYGTLLSTADTGITRTDVMKCMYTFIYNCMYISTSYYRVLVQELRVFRPQNAYDFRVILHDLGTWGTEVPLSTEVRLFMPRARGGPSDARHRLMMWHDAAC